MTEHSENFSERAAAFQKIWTDSISKLLQAAFTFTPNSAPPELLRDIRDGIFKALAEAWNEFLRSPEFQDGMKQWMDNAVAFRRMSNDFMSKVRHEMQAPSRGDTDTVILAVRHLERSMLDRLADLEKQVNQLNQQRGASARQGRARKVKLPKGSKRR